MPSGWRRWQERWCGRVWLELNQPRWNVGSWRRRSAWQRLAELFLRHLPQESALEHPGAGHVDVTAQPLATGDVRILVARGDVELLALTRCRRLHVLLRPVGIVERIEARDDARTRARCRGERILAQNGVSIEPNYRGRTERPRDGRLSVLPQDVEASGPERRADHRDGRAWGRRRRRGFPG